jgi:hypothetical protein
MRAAMSDRRDALATALTRRLTDESNPHSAASRARQRRWQLLLDAFPDLASMRVIDLGGLVGEWQRAPLRPASVLVVNLFDQAGADGIETLTVDACALSPSAFGAPPGRPFDLVYSSSVLDLVGGHWRRVEFARVVGELADRHWVQTANRYFPLDAYTLFPFQPSLPLEARAWLAPRWPLGYRRAPDRHAGVLLNLERDPLSAAALAAYFPASEIWRERVAGLTKSVIAVKRR